jgi:hypothetical protein
MTTFSNILKLTFQETGENDDLWGDVANNGVFQLLENAIAKIESVDVTAANVTLVYDNGATNSNDARAGILDVTGAPGTVREVIIPEGAGITRFYLVRNSITDANDVTVKTLSGTGVTVPNGETRWVLSDGTNVDFVNAGTAATADLATNADNLLSDGGYVTGENFVRTDLGVGTSKVQTFSQGQNAVRSALTWAGTVTINNAVSNAFELVVTSAITVTIQNPSTSTADADGQVIRLMIHHQTSGATINWGSAYAWAGGTAPALTTGTAGAVDYVAFEYYNDFPGGGRWVGSALLDVS